MLGAIRKFTALTLLVVSTSTVAANSEGTRQHSVKATPPGVSSTSGTTEYQLPELNHKDGIRKSRDPAKQQQKANAAILNDAFFVELDLFLDGDFDADGHFYVIDLSWDADTVFQSMDVYAVMWLSFEGGPWEEFLTTDVYTLNADSTTDYYRVESELQRGYPTGYYDILLELYDPVSGQLVAEVGPADSEVLAEIPLEDADRDAYYDDDHHHGGSLGLYSIIAAAGLLYYRRRGFFRQRAAKL